MIIELPSYIVDMLAPGRRERVLSETEVIRRMFTILRISQEEKKKGNDLGIVNGDKVPYPERARVRRNMSSPKSVSISEIWSYMQLLGSNLRIGSRR